MRQLVLAAAGRGDPEEGAGRQSGMNTTDFDAMLTVRIERDQIVFNSAGKAQCGS